jgi:hypothetical protein
MLFPGFVLATLAFSSSLTSTAQCDAGRIFAQSRMVTGGHRWDNIGEIVADGRITDSGATGTLYLARDLKTGRSTFVESLDQGRIAYIYDGHTKWEQDQGLGVHPLSAPDSVARAITDAYVNRNGFWKGPPGAARIDCLPIASESGRTFDVVRVTPSHGSFVDLWIDRSTHLIDRTIKQLPTTVNTESYGDYREVGGLLLPFNITQRFTDANGSPAVTSQSIRVYRLLRTARAPDFRRPPDPTNARIANRSASARIPFSVDKGVIVLNVRVDGKGPFAFTFDPGAQGALTSVASVQLGLKAGKMANVRRLQVGDAEVDDIALPVYGGRPIDLFPERTPQRAPIAGSLGPELLDRFVVRLDYATQTMTLAPFQDFRCAGKGVAQRFRMQEDDDVPLVPAVIDGRPGWVEYDVRAPSSLILFRPFLEVTALSNRYRTSSGSVDSLALGGVILHGVKARFFAARAGKFASRTEAGLVGSGVLSHFITTMDYRTQTICFEHPAVSHPDSDRQWSQTNAPTRGHERLVRYLHILVPLR